MGTFTVQTFAVSDPGERMRELRKQLAIVDVTGFVRCSVDSVKAGLGEASNPAGVVSLSTPRIYPKGRSIRTVHTDDESIFFPFMEAFLEPGEQGCVLQFNTTVDQAWLTVYRSQSDGSVEIIDSLEDDQNGDCGSVVREKCFEQYGFEPTRRITSIESEAEALADPFLWYRDSHEFEEKLAAESCRKITHSQNCPECGDSAVSEGFGNRFLEWDACRSSCGLGRQYVYTPETIESPFTVCSSCGGDFEARDLQYPGLGSTAYRCIDCDTLAFDTLQLSTNKLHPDTLRTTVAPSEQTHRDLDPPDEDGSGSSSGDDLSDLFG